MFSGSGRARLRLHQAFQSVGCLATASAPPSTPRPPHGRGPSGDGGALMGSSELETAVRSAYDLLLDRGLRRRGLRRRGAPLRRTASSTTSGSPRRTSRDRAGVRLPRPRPCGARKTWSLSTPGCGRRMRIDAQVRGRRPGESTELRRPAAGARSTFGGAHEGVRRVACYRHPRSTPPAIAWSRGCRRADVR